MGIFHMSRHFGLDEADPLYDTSDPAYDWWDEGDPSGMYEVEDWAQ